ncbi:MAG: ubiquinol-cytochrome c reductase iron-sulfur subunit [Cyanobacteria bacterium J06581_3]
MKRRAFMNWVGVSFMATSLPVVIAACSPAETDDTAAEEADPCAATETATEEVDSSIRDDGFAALGTTEELDSAGFLASKTFVAGSVIVIRDPDNADGVIALDSLCTHQGCHVAWEDTEFACPCHGSKFSPAGEVAEGPATEALGTYEAKVEEGLVLIKAA